MKNNITTVVKNGMCLGCGACIIACDFNAIKIYYNKSIGNYQPLVLKNKCKSCGNCLDVCFGNNVDYKLSNKISDELKSSIGNIIKTYLGYTNEDKLRYNASSGGIVSTLLKFLFNEKIIDGAIVAKTNSGKIPLTKSIIIQDESGILKTMGSKYVPTLLTDALKNLKKNNSYALVGLPCQIFSVNKLIEKKKLGGRIFIRIGIFCGGFFNYNGIKYLMERYNIKQTKIISIDFRGKGWPGRLKLITKYDSLEIPLLQYWPIIQPWFSPRRCEICLSGFNRNSDISCGDAWLPELIKKDKLGTSIIISRTIKGNLLLNKLISGGYIKTKEVNSKFIIKSQNSMIRFKHLSISTRLKVLNFLNKKSFLNNKDYKKEHSINIYALIGELRLQVGKLLAKREGTWNLFKLFIRLDRYVFSLIGFLKKNLKKEFFS